jgi:hypothetical protein
VPRHDDTGAGIDRGPERDQLLGLQPGEVPAQHRHTVMRVADGRSVSGEVLERGRDASLLDPLRHRRSEPTYKGRVAAERPSAQVRRRLAVEQVADRREKERGSHRPHFGRDRTSDAPRQLLGMRRAEREVPGPGRRADADRLQLAAFLIQPDDEWGVACRACGLERGAQLPHLSGRRHVHPAEERDPARTSIGDRVEDVGRRFSALERAQQARPDECRRLGFVHRRRLVPVARGR